jgi:hypothetical protein
VHSILSCFRHLCFASVLLPVSPSFCLYFLYRVSVPCDCLPSLDAEPILSVSPYLQFLYTDTIPIALGHWDSEMKIRHIMHRESGKSNVVHDDFMECRDNSGICL